VNWPHARQSFQNAYISIAEHAAVLAERVGFRNSVTIDGTRSLRSKADEIERV